MVQRLKITKVESGKGFLGFNSEDENENEACQDPTTRYSSNIYTLT